jgi:hypothetical protein
MVYEANFNKHFKALNPWREWEKFHIQLGYKLTFCKQQNRHAMKLQLHN